MTRLAAFLSAVVLLSSCAVHTPYQSERFGGGFVDMPLSGGRYRIFVRGNGYPDRQRVTNIAMVRAAELALQNGYTHFAIDDVGETSKTKLARGADGISSFENAYVTLIVRFFKGAAAAGSLDAKSSLDRPGPVVGYEPDHK